LDLGIIKNTKITPIIKSPSGNPIAYEIRKSVIALREDDTKKIEIISEESPKDEFTISLAGNPNVGKSTIFNNLTGMNQHTGNWPGKTVSNATGKCTYKDTSFLFVDIPGTYSLMSNSEEEEIARDYICFGDSDITVVIVDATCLERHLNLVFQILEVTKNVVICINLLDQAKKKGISINLESLSEELSVPVVGVIARKHKTLEKLLDTIYNVCSNSLEISPKIIEYEKSIEDSINLLIPELAKLEIKNDYIKRWITLKLIDGDENIIKSISKNLNISFSNLKDVIFESRKNLKMDANTFRDTIAETIILRSEAICQKVCVFENQNYNETDRKIDKILTSKQFGIPIMIGFLSIIFWITIVGANYPSTLLLRFFDMIQNKLYILFKYINMPNVITGMLIDGMYQTLVWVISVMLPPMAIFFPLFSFLEDLGYLPRIAFNLDNYFKKCCASGKQALSMCMRLWL